MDDKLVERAIEEVCGRFKNWSANQGQLGFARAVGKEILRAIEATRSSEVIEALTEAKREIEIGLEYVIEAANEDGCKYGKEAKVFKQHMRGIERMEMLLAKIDKALSTPSSENSDGA